jgi:poly(A) polymerase
LNFDIEAATAAAIATHANMIQRCAGERIWTELALILACPNSFGQLYKMAHSGLLNAIFPELGPLKGCRQSEPHHLDVFEHTLLAYQALEALLAHPTRHLSGPAAGFATALPKEHQVLLKLALLLHDIGKPGQRTTDAAGKVHFYGHAGAGAQLAGPIFKRLHLSRRHANWVEGVIGQHQRPLALYVAQSRNGLRPKAIGKFLRVGGAITPHLIVHAMADNLGKNPTNHHHHLAPMAFWEQLLNAYFATAAPPGAPPLLGGHDLMAAFGLTPSPLLGTLLRGIEEARLAGTIGNRQQALEWVERYLKEKERRSK